MNLIYIVTLLTTLIVLTTLANESFAQVTWKTFNEKNGLYTIQVPSNWYAVKIAPEDKTAAIDDQFSYTGKGKSYAFFNIMFDTSLYSDAKDASDDNIAANQNLDKFKLLQPTECEKYTVNNVQACSSVITFKLEDDEQRTDLQVVTVDSDGVLSNFIFGATNDIFDRFLPVGEYMMNSIKIDHDKLLNTLSIEPLDNNTQQNDIPTNDIPDIISNSELPAIPSNSTKNNGNASVANNNIINSTN
jgi:hypothetical protein